MTLVKTVHIVDDDQFLREAATLLLETVDYRVVNHASGAAFLADLAKAEPGCVVLDINMPEMSGLEVQSAMKERGIRWPVIVLTGHGDIRIAVQAMRNGALEFLEKPYVNAELLAAVAEAFDLLDEASSETTRTSEARHMVQQLTPREFEVLRAMLSGMATKMIAYHLGLSNRTVDVYRSNVMSKLRARNVSIAIQVALVADVSPLIEG